MPDRETFKPFGQVSLLRRIFGRPGGVPRLPLLYRAIVGHQVQPFWLHFSRNRSINA